MATQLSAIQVKVRINGVDGETRLAPVLYDGTVMGLAPTISIALSKFELVLAEGDVVTLVFGGPVPSSGVNWTAVNQTLELRPK